MPEALPVPPADLLRSYVPSLVRRWIADDPGRTHAQLVGSVAFVDVSGFTRLSERLARLGRVGAEELTEIIGSCFARLLAVAHAHDGYLVKFGGDALLLLFTGAEHQVTACRAAAGMRQTLRDLRQLHPSGGRLNLRVSVAVHSGTFDFFLVGGSHRELIVAGPAASETVALESAAEAGEIVVSPATAAALSPSFLGAAKGAGRLLRRPPHPLPPREPDIRLDAADAADVFACIPVAIREQLQAGLHEPEHRRVTVAFLRFAGTDAFIQRDGTQATAQELDGIVRDVEEAADRRAVSFLGSDIDHDGGKIILAAGAPVAWGNEEERALLVLRETLDRRRTIPLRAGVSRGYVFAGDIGPPYRRTYTVMGDAVNLAARLMAKAAPGQILATQGVIEQSRTTFQTGRLEPFIVKGKSRPVQAFSVGRVAGVRRDAGEARLPLIGREREMEELRVALASVREGTGRLVEIVGEPGLGKSRLVDELRQDVGDVPVITLSCEPYQATTPYFPFRGPSLEALRIAEDASDEAAAAQVHKLLRRRAPELLPWAPLLGMLLGIELPATPETAQLEERFLRPRMNQSTFALLAGLNPGPTVLIFEDTHWMDEASADLLRYLTGRLAEVPWLVCVTHRDWDIGFTAPETPQVVTLRLAPLEVDAAATLADAVTERSPLPQHEMAMLVERSGGSPLFLKELAAAAARTTGSVEELPDTVEALITARIDRLAPDDRLVLRYLAVLGQSFPRHLADSVLPAALPSYGDLDRHHLGEFLEYDQDNVRFSHGLIRDAAYEALSYRLRRRLHSEVGDTIERAAGDDPDSQAAVLSFHFFHAQRHAEAWRYSLAAAESARALYANVAAAEFYQRAVGASLRMLDLVPLEVARVHEALGDVRAHLGAYTEAAVAYRAARPFVVGDPAAEARLLLKIARTQGWLGRYPLALRSIRRAMNTLENVESVDAARQRAQLMVWYARFCQEEGRHAAAIKWSRLGIAEATSADEREALAHAYKVLDWAYMGLGQPENAVYSPKALAIYEELGDLPGQADMLNNMGGVAYWQGHWNDALELYQRALDLGTRTGAELGVAVVKANIGEILSDQGRLEEAEALIRDALRVWQAAGHRSGIAYAKRDLARVASRSHRKDEALRLFSEVRAEFEDVGARVEALETDARIAESHMFEGEAQEALRVADAALRRARTLGGVTAQSPMLHRIRGYALLQLGQLAAARKAFENSLEAGRQRDADYEVALALRGLADLASLTDNEASEDHSSESSAILGRLGIVEAPEVPLASVAT